MSELVNLQTLGLYGVGGGGLLYGLSRLKTRLELSLAKHKSLAGHPRMARRVAAQLHSYSYTEQQMFGVDGAPDTVIHNRRTAFNLLADQFRTRRRGVCGASGRNFAACARLPQRSAARLLH